MKAHCNSWNKKQDENGFGSLLLDKDRNLKKDLNGNGNGEIFLKIP